MRPYEQARTGAAIGVLMTSVLPYVLLTIAMYLLLDVSVWLTLALAPFAAGFLVRSFIVFHDCGHGSFTSNRRVNRWLGWATGLMVWAAFDNWKEEHALHHGTAGDLERRGQGDVTTWTVEEYFSKPAKSRFGYRLFRNPLVMFGIGPIWSLILRQRFIRRDMRPAQRRSAIRTNIALVILVGGLVWLMGWQAYLLVFGPPILLAGATGVWLFFVQHNFEDAYWEHSDNWNFVDAALHGSSYLKLPKVLQFFTGNIGLHHVHHLSARIPCYNLQRAHDENAIFQAVPVLTFGEALKSARLKLIDTSSGQMVTFRQGRAIAGKTKRSPRPAAATS